LLATKEGLPVKFSERYGYVPVRSIIQIDSVDGALRNSLWSLLKIFIWDQVERRPQFSSMFGGNPRFKALCDLIWFSYFKLPLDTLKDDWTFVYEQLRGYYFECEWFELYDFVEFVADNYQYDDRANFIDACNGALKTEMSAYRFVDGSITRITDEEEISAIEDAINTGKDPVQAHLRRALELLSDRENPDYRNSIKESISAVESLVQDVLGEKGTLGKLIKKLEIEIGLHPALGKTFDHLYGYTSDKEGIRHAMLDSATVDFEDAKFLLVVCSAFVNFVHAKIRV
jgi:predicted DNA-binding protein YlxM (UPF0122 family)